MWVSEVDLLLVFVLFLTTAALAYIISEYDIIHPFSIIASIMAFTSFMSCLAPSEWHIGISAFACAVVLLGLFCFGAGSIWADRNLAKKIAEPVILEQQQISNWMIIVISIGLILFSYYEFKVLYEASLRLGNQDGYYGVIRIVRKAVEAQIYTFPRILVYGNYIAEGLFYCCSYVLFSRFLASEGKPGLADIKYIMPLLASMPLLVLSAARLMLFQRIIFLLVLGGILYQRKHAFSLLCKKKMFVLTSLTGVVFLVFFLLFGFFTNKVTLESNPFSVLAHYGGLSLPALSIYLDSTFLESPYIGVSTMQELYRKLSLFGIEVPDWREIRYDFLPFVSFNGIDTNVYTGLRRYIQDYGFVGMSLIMATLGMVYTSLYQYARLCARKGIYVVLYATIAWPLFWFINEEAILTTIVQTRTLYIFLIVLLFDKFFIKSQCNAK